MNQQTFDGIVNVLRRGAGVMAEEYVQAFVATVNELQKRLQTEAAAKTNSTDEVPESLK